MNIYTLNLKPLAPKITVEHFEQLCRLNPELKLETNDRGELLVMSPTGYETGMNNAGLIAQFWNWNRQYDLGVVCVLRVLFCLIAQFARLMLVGLLKKELQNLVRKKRLNFHLLHQISF